MDAETRQRLAELPPAGLLRRFGALVYDGLLVLALVLTTTGLANLFAGRPDIPDDAVSVSLENMQTVSGPLLGSIIVIVVFTFFAYFWVRHGRTLGMQAWRLRVQTSDGYNITLNQSWKRFLAAIPALGLLGIGYFWMWLDPARRTWPDKLSGTRVVTLPADMDPQLKG